MTLFFRLSGASADILSAIAFTCPVSSCNKKFAVRSNAKRHLRTHGIMPTPDMSFISTPAEDKDVAPVLDTTCWIPQTLKERNLKLENVDTCGLARWCTRKGIHLPRYQLHHTILPTGDAYLGRLQKLPCASARRDMLPIKLSAYHETPLSYLFFLIPSFRAFINPVLNRSFLVQRRIVYR